MHRPAIAAHAIAAIQGPRQQHVLCPDEDGSRFRVNIPVFCLFSSHQHVDANLAIQAGTPSVVLRHDSSALAVLCRLSLHLPSEHSHRIQPVQRAVPGLFDKRAHRQTVDQPTWRLPWAFLASPKPAQDHGGGFAGAGRDIYEATFHRATFYRRHPRRCKKSLVGVGGFVFACGPLEEVLEGFGHAKNPLDAIDEILAHIAHAPSCVSSTLDARYQTRSAKRTISVSSNGC